MPCPHECPCTEESAVEEQRGTPPSMGDPGSGGRFDGRRHPVSGNRFGKQSRNSTQPRAYPDARCPKKGRTASFLLIAGATLLSVLPPLQAGDFSSGETQAILVELFTSEGCRNCPAADQWFNGLKNSSALWEKFVPVAFHVDYWDYAGWKDPIASPEYSSRQRLYARQNANRLYTPSFFINGEEWKGYFYSLNLPLEPASKPGVLTVHQTGETRFEVAFSPTRPAKRNYFLHAALLGTGLSTQVLRGENPPEQTSEPAAQKPVGSDKKSDGKPFTAAASSSN